MQRCATLRTAAFVACGGPRNAPHPHPPAYRRRRSTAPPRPDLGALRVHVAEAAGTFYGRYLVDGAPRAAVFDGAALAYLPKALGHTFTHRWLLRAALLHRSYEAEVEKSRCGEILAWLGDSALHGGLTTALLAAYPAAPIGDLTVARAYLSSRAVLADVGRDLGLDRCLLVGRSFTSADSGAGGPTRAMLGEAAEAVIGAVVADAGADAAVASYFRVAGRLPDRLDDLLQGGAMAMAKRDAPQGKEEG